MDTNDHIHHMDTYIYNHSLTSIVSSDWSDTLVWFGQILLYLHFYHPVYIILGLNFFFKKNVCPISFPFNCNVMSMSLIECKIFLYISLLSKVTCNNFSFLGEKFLIYQGGIISPGF